MAPWPACWSSRFLACSALHVERKRQRERGRDGELTGPETEDREAVGAVRRELTAEVGGGTGSELGCGCLAKKTDAR